MSISLERAYDDHDTSGTRVLVDRIWPRGVKKVDLKLDDWNKSVAPSDDLRKWFDHDPKRWKEFNKRYSAELEDNPDAWDPLLDRAKNGNLVLIFGAKDRKNNNAVALCNFLKKHL